MILLASITDSPLDATEFLSAVADPAAGASAVFVGTVRDHDPGALAEVVRLEYSAHPDAARVLAELAAEADAPGLRIAVGHRTGDLRVGEAAIICAVSSAHRADAFEVSRALVERVKERLPVWKRQIEVGGAAHWVGLGSLLR